jgi:hypothetical protein
LDSLIAVGFIFFFRANPYQKIVQILGRILEPFMEPNCVYAYGFGDAVSQDISVFNLLEDEDSPCLDFKQGDHYFFGIQIMIFFLTDTAAKKKRQSTNV